MGVPLCEPEVFLRGGSDEAQAKQRVVFRSMSSRIALVRNGGGYFIMYGV
jgi:hypothetical protein